MSTIINKITVTNRWPIRVSRAVICVIMIKLNWGYQMPPMNRRET